MNSLPHPRLTASLNVSLKLGLSVILNTSTGRVSTLSVLLSWHLISTMKVRALQRCMQRCMQKESHSLQFVFHLLSKFPIFLLDQNIFTSHRLWNGVFCIEWLCLLQAQVKMFRFCFSLQTIQSCCFQKLFLKCELSYVCVVVKLICTWSFYVILWSHSFWLAHNFGVYIESAEN